MSSSRPPSSASSIFSSSPPTSHPSSITKLHSTHSTAGYRDGISLSKTPHSLQAGFDEGYSLGATLGLRVGYILGIFEALRRDVDESEGEDGRMERMWREAKSRLRMEEIFKEEYFGGDGVWKFDVVRKEGSQAEERHYPGSDNPTILKEDEEEEEGEEEKEDEEGGGSTTFFDVADLHPLIREWMQKAKDEMKRCGVEDWRSIELERGGEHEL